MQTPKGHCLTN